MARVGGHGSAPALAVTFDYGQTLGELDTALLAARLRERDVEVEPLALDAAWLPALAAYDAAIKAGVAGHPWHLLMQTLLVHAGARGEVTPAIAWLFEQQRVKNLWRRPVPGMLELVRALRARGVPLGVISNSEGKLAELAGEMGIREEFVIISDSGALGMEKPDRGIFDVTVAALGVPHERVVHIGDSLAADVRGALAAGLRAVWFRGTPGREPAGVPVCPDAESLTLVLRAHGLPL